MKLNRKDLFRFAGAAMASGASFAYPGLGGFARATIADIGGQDSKAGTSPQAIRMVGRDPTFAAGHVVERSPLGVVVKSHSTVRAIRIEPGMLVWKEFLLPADVIRIGDWLDVKGTPLDDGSLRARSEWIFVNIGRREGVLVTATRQRVTIRHNKGTETLELSSALEVIVAKTGAPIPGGVTALPPGTFVEAVGLRVAEGGFRATRIWT